jgi:hypothetical protein
VTGVQTCALPICAESLPRERRGKPYNLRPLIEELSILPPALPASSPWNTVSLQTASPPPSSSADAVLSGVQRLFMRLAARAGATARPEEVLDVLGIPSDTARIERTHLILNREIG